MSDSFLPFLFGMLGIGLFFCELSRSVTSVRLRKIFQGVGLGTYFVMSLFYLYIFTL